jgi:hypothetical protein
VRVPIARLKLCQRSVHASRLGSFKVAGVRTLALNSRGPIDRENTGRFKHGIQSGIGAPLQRHIGGRTDVSGRSERSIDAPRRASNAQQIVRRCEESTRLCPMPLWPLARRAQPRHSSRAHRRRLPTPGRPGTRAALRTGARDRKDLANTLAPPEAFIIEATDRLAKLSCAKWRHQFSRLGFRGRTK